MRPVVLALVGTVLVLGGASLSFGASESAFPKVRVELVSEVQGISAGSTVWIGLRQEIAPGWHTYWINPGDSGEPARIEWRLPEGFTAGDIVWPHPERIPVGSAMSYGYTGEVVLPIPVTAPTNLVPGTRVTLEGQASWLVCEKICIPEEAPVALTLPVTSGTAPPDPRGATLIAGARRAAPASSPWGVSFTTTAESVRLTVAAPDLVAERIAEVWFYPARWGVLDHAAPQRSRIDGDGITLDVARGPLPEAVVEPIEGVLVVAERLEGGVARHAFSVRAAPRPGAAGGAAGQPGMPLLSALVLALIGGLVLNAMPCVLPVLAVKALGLVRHGSDARAVLRWHGVAYTGGVLVSFALVAGALIALRAGGAQLGWGFQLQSPVFVTLLAYILFVMALSLSGIVLVGGRLAGAGQVLAVRPGYAGSFFTGTLATVAATPCTAPFMGAAVGYAITQPWTTALLVFEALGVGLALPYLLLTLVPAWRRFLPRPGPWMERFKQLLAFPLYGSVAWLVWVVSQQAGSQGVAAALTGLVVIGFAAWLYQASRDLGRLGRWTTTGVLVVLALGATALGLLVEAGPPSRSASSTPTVGVGWEPFSAKRLAELRREGKPVFVNFTAAWCITCLVNERVALRAPAVAAVFARKGVVLLKADWTKRDPAITEVLGSFGRSGVPLYLLYPPGVAAGRPTVLPQILSEGAVVEAVENI